MTAAETPNESETPAHSKELETSPVRAENKMSRKGSHLLAEDTKVEDKVIREISETSTGVDEGSDAAAGL